MEKDDKSPSFMDSSDEIEQLDFKPQREIIYNELLPYADQLKDESKELFNRIKVNLSKSVLLREMDPACKIWSDRLVRYIKMYGLKFSKEDHISLVYLFYDLLTIPDLEPYLVKEFIYILTVLINKKSSLLPGEVVLEWRPLYELCKNVLEPKQKKMGIYRNFPLKGRLYLLVRRAKTYFPETATQEILDELKPDLNILVGCRKAIYFMTWFLPVSLPPEKSHLGYKLWLTDIMEIWATCNNSPHWEARVMSLIAQLAAHNIGYIDWEPYIPIMFTRFLRSFNLPVAYKKHLPPRTTKMHVGDIALWIVSVLDRENSCQWYLSKFLKTIESYFHPANFGVWFFTLKELLRKLPECFIRRLHRERYQKLTWQNPIPEDRKLTEEDIDEFIESVKGIAMQSVFSKMGSNETAIALQHLATIRPSKIIPELIDKLYSTLHSVTEPHKLTSLMRCMGPVARPLVQGVEYDYPEGPTHVIPLLMSILPGIDANDFNKCLATIYFIFVFVALIPIVDSSQASLYWSDLTDEEETICVATSYFKDFVVQFFDRIFNFIENTSLVHPRMEKDNSKRSKREDLAEITLVTGCHLVLSQCSSDIFKAALEKLHTFVTERVLETNVAGHFVATLSRTFSRVNPEETLKCLLPHLCDTILSLTESEEVLEEETLDSELHYNLLILSELVYCGHGILPFVPKVLAVLDRTLHLACLEGFTISSKILNNLLLSLTKITCLDKRGLSRSYDDHVKDHLLIRDWGKQEKLSNVNLRWHVPGDEEIETVKEIVWKYLPPELKKIDEYINDENYLSRKELLCSLNIINGILGAHFLLPQWDEEPLELFDSVLKTESFNLTLGYKGQVNMPDGSNVRYVVAQAIDRLQKKILSSAEDDTKSLFAIIEIWDRLLLNRVRIFNFDASSKNLQMTKKALENRLVGKKRHMRIFLIMQTLLQHELRSVMGDTFLTETHKMILIDLFELSCSQYSQVRVKAQIVLHQGLYAYRNSYTILTPKLLKNLEEGSLENHERFKGSLYVLRSIIGLQPDWEFLLKILPALVKGIPSEKSSIVQLLKVFGKTVSTIFAKLPINSDVPDRCLEKARILLESNPSSGETVTESQIENGKLILKKKNEQNEQLYLALVNSLMDVIEKENLHWRYHIMALSFLRDLAHPDVPYPARIVKTFLHTLIHESNTLRSIAVRGTLQVLVQQKKAPKKIKLTVEQITGCPVPEILTPGIRPDNLWLQYDSEKIPKSSSEWDEPRYLHKNTIGYLQWPKELEMHAPYSEQLSLDRMENELEPEEREIVDFFTNSDYVADLIKYFSMELKKEKEKLNRTRYYMFKKLFRNHGDSLFGIFKPHLEKLVLDQQECGQKCAAEIIGGVILGSKHWPYEKVATLWEFLGPLIRTALANMTKETIRNWVAIFTRACENRDPNRNHWLLEVLMEDPIRDEASFLVYGRLFILQNALRQQGWRVAELHKRLLDYFENFFSHPLQNVREKIGSLLINIFESDIKLMGSKTLGPYPADFIAAIAPKLEGLYSLTASKDASLKSPQLESNLEKNDKTGHEGSNGIVEGLSEKEASLNLFKIVCTWISGTLTLSHNCVVPEYYTLFPLICSLESYEQDEEVVQLCTLTMSAMASCGTHPQHIQVVFESILKVAESESWWTKSSLVGFFQIFLFRNMGLILENVKWTENTLTIVLKFLEDERIEVREKAAEVLGSLLHCDFIENAEDLLKQFKEKLNIKNRKMASKNPDVLKVLHAGILGLCAFVNASPYDVPDYVPDILFLLGNHLNDPQPIPRTIQKTLGHFKRTHHDNWEWHQSKFTEAQLQVFNDLNFPPSYCV